MPLSEENKHILDVVSKQTTLFAQMINWTDEEYNLFKSIKQFNMFAPGAFKMDYKTYNDIEGSLYFTYDPETQDYVAYDPNLNITYTRNTDYPIDAFLGALVQEISEANNMLINNKTNESVDEKGPLNVINGSLNRISDKIQYEESVVPLGYNEDVFNDLIEKYYKNAPQTVLTPEQMEYSSEYNPNYAEESAVAEKLLASVNEPDITEWEQRILDDEWSEEEAAEYLQEVLRVVPEAWPDEYPPKHIKNLTAEQLEDNTYKITYTDAADADRTLYILANVKGDKYSYIIHDPINKITYRAAHPYEYEATHEEIMVGDEGSMSVGLGSMIGNSDFLGNAIAHIISDRDDDDDIEFFNEVVDIRYELPDEALQQINNAEAQYKEQNIIYTPQTKEQRLEHLIKWKEQLRRAGHLPQHTSDYMDREINVLQEQIQKEPIKYEHPDKLAIPSTADRSIEIENIKRAQEKLKNKEYTQPSEDIMKRKAAEQTRKIFKQKLPKAK